MLWILFAILSLAEATPVRICVRDSQSSECAQMAADLPDSFSCVTAPDTFRCLKLVSEGKADITNADHFALFIAGKYFDLVPIVTELIDENTFKYQGIALVSKNSDIQSPRDLKGKSSCHTGFKRTVGWQMPVSKLLYANIMELDCKDGELGAVDDFFSGSCVPGPWTGDAYVDGILKNKHRNLCSKCKNPEACAKDDEYAGYEGVIRCLSDGAADVAFTKIPVLKKYLETTPSFADKADLLCFDGGRKSLTDPEPCVWGSRPTNAFVAKSGNPELEHLVSTILNVQTRYAVPQIRTPDWYSKSFLSGSEVTSLQRTQEGRRNYTSYLGDFIHTIRKPRQGCENAENDHHITFCVTTSEELGKCVDVSQVTDGRGLWQSVGCLKKDTYEECMEEVRDGHADLIVLDGGLVHKAGKYYDLQPLGKDVYKDETAVYYSVAVLKSSSDVTSISGLRGLRSCHSGIGHAAGWVLPMQELLSKDLLATDGVCTHPGGLADFFSGGSCAPGADNPKYNPQSVKTEELCKQCAGDNNGLYKCSRDLRERYYGNSGAFRCLVEGGGDVAFIKHFTAPEYTDGNSQLPWAKDLISEDFKLLCSGGGNENVYNYTSCNIGSVPFRVIMNGPSISEDRRLHSASLLGEYTKFFQNDSKLYRMFYQNAVHDRIFKDLADSVRVIPFETSYQEVLGEKLTKSFDDADPRACS